VYVYINILEGQEKCSASCNTLFVIADDEVKDMPVMHMRFAAWHDVTHMTQEYRWQTSEFLPLWVVTLADRIYVEVQVCNKVTALQFSHRLILQLASGQTKETP